jgi:homoserine dehydrogenase
MNIGLIGTGTIGSGVIHLYQSNFAKLSSHAKTPFKLKTICDLDFSKCPYDLSSFQKTNSFKELIADPEINIIIELIGGDEPARTIIESALKAKKHVVTANKLVLAKYGKDLLKLAEDNNVSLLYEASVGGAIPIINNLKDSLSPNNFKEMVGILNGTTNFILTKMQKEGADYAVVLKEAQKLGYAEADPSSDVEGMDSRYKLSILASIAFHADINIEQILMEGITKISAKDINYAKNLDASIKLLAIARNTDKGLELRVHPVILKNSHPLASVNDVFNAIYVDGDATGESMFYGRGAGSIPTAGSVWADILNIINGTAYVTEKKLKVNILPKEEIVSKYYIRLLVEDKPGVLAEISGIFAKLNISIKEAIQKGADEDAELVIVTHSIKEGIKNKAIEKIKALSCIKDVASIIRVGI